MIDDLAQSGLAAAGALAAAAFREDPGIAHILRGDAARRMRLPSLMTSLFAIDKELGGKVRGAFDGGVLVGVSSVLPSGTGDPGLLAWIGRLHAVPWLLVSPGTAIRGLDAAAAAARLRPASADYLHILAVHPACQGRGIGAALVRDALASGRDLHLETYAPENRAWYATRGFRETAEVRSAARPPFWTFLRKA